MMKDLADLPGLEGVARGALNEHWLQALSKVLENIDDPNTNPTAKRSITMTINFAPRGSRDAFVLDYEVKTKLAGPEPLKEQLFIGRKDGEIQGVYSDNPAQLTIDDVEPDPEPKKGELRAI